MASSMMAKVNLLSESVQHIPAGQEARCQFGINNSNNNAIVVAKESVDINIFSPSKVPVAYRLKEGVDGLYVATFSPTEVGTYALDLYVSGTKVLESPVLFKIYDARLIRVTDLRNGLVGQVNQFRVDASQAGEGQLEISINDGEVPNHVQVLGGGRCLVHFTPESSRSHKIDIKFNGENVPKSPFMLSVNDTSEVSVDLRHLDLMAVNEKASFRIHVDTNDNAELAVAVSYAGHLGQRDVPVEVSGNVETGFLASFVPENVGPYVVSVDYNNTAVEGTPFTGKAYDAEKVSVSSIPWGTIGKSVEFTVDASQAGEGNLEITISAKNRNIPTQVHPQGSARFAVSFVPLEAVDHVINISFNKHVVPGAPFRASIHTDPNQIMVTGHALAATPVRKEANFVLANLQGDIKHLEVVIDAPNGEVLPIEIVDNQQDEEQEKKDNNEYAVHFKPLVAGEHQIYLNYAQEPIPGSPFACKVYDVEAIRVRETSRGIVGKPVTFLVETSKAGPGNLEVTVNNGQVPTTAQAQGNHTYAISFVPKEAESHVVELKFNGEDVPGSPFNCVIVDAAKVSLSGAGLEKVPVGEQASFFIEGQIEMGDPEVKIVNPMRKVVPNSIRFIAEGHYGVDFTPLVVGDHQVEVKMGGIQVQGSPWITKAFDVSKVLVSNITSGHVGKPVYFSIDASQAGAGNLEIIVSVNGRNVPNYVQSEGNAKFRVNFKPTEAEIHLLSIKFNNQFVPNSPFECIIQGNQAVLTSGPGIQQCPINKETSFTIAPISKMASMASPVYSVHITSPNGMEVVNNLDMDNEGVTKVHYTPVEVGPHMIRVVQDEVPVEGSPFTCNVYDTNNIEVAGLPKKWSVNKSCTFTVDASKAGEGTLELVVTTTKASVRAEVQARNRGLYDVSFVPQEMLPHFVNITFNDEHIRESPFSVNIVTDKVNDKSTSSNGNSNVITLVENTVVLRGKGAKSAMLGRVAHFELDILDDNTDWLDALSILDEANRKVRHEVIPIEDEEKSSNNKCYRVRFSPERVGDYRVVVDDEDEVKSRSQVINVFDPYKVKLHQDGPFVVNEKAQFVIDTSSAGKGTLSIDITCCGRRVSHSIRDIGYNRFEVAFNPELPTQHRVDVRFNNESIGSKHMLEVDDHLDKHTTRAEGKGLYQAVVGRDSSFVIDRPGSKLKNAANDFDVLITGPPEGTPANEAVPLRCYQQKDGRLLVDFRTTNCGLHLIEVFENGQHIHGSPYQCLAFDPKEVKVSSESSLDSVWAYSMVSLLVDCRTAGQADLGVKVLAPNGEPLSVECRESTEEPGLHKVDFVPEVAGEHRVVVTLGDLEITHSPVFVRVNAHNTISEKRSNNPRPNHQPVFELIQGYDIEKRLFVPKLTGRQDARVVIGADQSGAVDFLEAHIEMPSGKRRVVHVDLIDNHTAEVRFHPYEEGSYALHLLFNGQELPISPLTGDQTSHLPLASTPSSNVATPPLTTGSTTSPGSKVKLTGVGLVRAQVGEEARFRIELVASTTRQPQPKVQLEHTETQSVVPVHVSLSKSAVNTFEAVYVPRMAGGHLLVVLINDRAVAECPVRVDELDEEHPATRVRCSGEGLRLGTLGKDILSFIDTRKAGPGELSVHCVGPKAKTAYCELNDHQDGTFTLNLKPQEAGRHQLSIKFGGEHVRDSPFAVRVNGAPDPDRVRVFGPGVEHGVLANFQSRFMCDTRGAGAGQLTVRVRGPKGAFRVEMQRESHKDRTILCKYEPTEPGDYRIEVKWSGEHVIGSPFLVMIVDTQEELARFLQGGGAGSHYGPGSELHDVYGSTLMMPSSRGNLKSSKALASSQQILPPWLPS